MKSIGAQTNHRSQENIDIDNIIDDQNSDSGVMGKLSTLRPSPRPNPQVNLAQNISPHKFKHVYKRKKNLHESNTEFNYLKDLSNSYDLNINTHNVKKTKIIRKLDKPKK